MKQRYFLFVAVIAVLLSGFNMVSGQFPIKIPKIKEPKVQQPKPEDDNSITGSVSRSGFPKYDYAKATSSPKLIRDYLEIKVKTETLNNVSRWLPQVQFDNYYDGSSKLRYAAEWFKPDGSPLFNEQLDADNLGEEQMVTTKSNFADAVFQANATAATGTYGLKVTDNKTGTVVFQGKFKVDKVPLGPGDPKRKAEFDFYVDNDWSLPIGYVGFDYGAWHMSDLYPSVFMWFKGNLDAKDFEARLFYNGQMLTSTDDGGTVNKTEHVRGESCFMNRDVCEYTLWKFNWNNFIQETQDYERGKYPKATFTRDKPGEYTVKIFHKGVQVREAKFNIDANGFVAPNDLTDQVQMVYGGTAVPVKVMGTLEKWNPNAYKTDAFYGHPLTGLVIP